MATVTAEHKIDAPGNETFLPSWEEIAERAYAIHVSGQGGSGLDDWLRAEDELRAERAS